MKIAKNLGISRTPVREALLELSSQGLVTFLPRKGLVVNKFNARDIDEIFEIREAIRIGNCGKNLQTSATPMDLMGSRIFWMPNANPPVKGNMLNL